MKKLGLLATVMAAIAMLAPPAIADTTRLFKPDEGTITPKEGETTITWDTSFLEDHYDTGHTVTMKVRWEVDEGYARFSKVGRRKKNRFVAKGVSATGPTMATDVTDTGSIIVCNGVCETEFLGTEGEFTTTVEFTELRCEEGDLDVKAKAHLKFFLFVDLDGIWTGPLDDPVPLADLTEFGFGLNVKVRDEECEAEPHDDGPDPLDIHAVHHDTL